MTVAPSPLLAPKVGSARMRALRYGLCVLLAAFCLWVASRGLDLDRVAALLGEVQVLWLLPAGLLTLLMSVVHATKVRLLMARLRRLSMRTVVSAEFVSILVDIVLPFRLQELVRAFIIGRGEGLRPSLVFGVQVVEKAVEVPMLLGMLLLLGLYHPLPAWASSTIYAGLWGAGLLLLGLVFVVALPRQAERPLGWLRSRALPGAVLLAGVLDQLLAGMRLAAARPTMILAIISITVVEWSIMGASFWLVGVSLGHALDGWHVLGLMVANFVAFAAPGSTSGAVGLYELAGKTMLTVVFGMQGEEALALVLLIHAVLLGFGVIGGILGLFMAQVSLGEVRRRVEAGEPVPVQPSVCQEKTD